MGGLFVNPTSSQATLTPTIKIKALRLCPAVDLDNQCFSIGAPIQPETACQAVDTSYGCGGGVPNNPLTLTMQDYVKNVLMHESSASDPFAALKAQAMISRMYGHVQYMASLPSPGYINNSTVKQVYIPNTPIHATVDNAVQETEGLLLKHDNQIINARYSATHGPATPEADYDPNYTKDGGEAYLKPIFDPVVGNGPGHGVGLSQVGASNWAKGLIDNITYYPAWDMWRILVHYYQQITLHTPAHIAPLPNDYRFNVLAIENFPEGFRFSPSNRSKGDIKLVIQNTGTEPFNIGNCYNSEFNLNVAYHIYDTDNNDLACDYSGGNPGGTACFEGVRTPLCLPGRTIPDLGSDPPFAVFGVVVVLPSQLPTGRCYNLRWDIELLPPHKQQTWISRLQETPQQAQWPTQDTRFCFYEDPISTAPDPPQNPRSSSHQVSNWTNQRDVNIAWDPPTNPPFGYEYKYQGAGSTINDGQWHFTSQTQANFRVTQGGSDHIVRMRAVDGGLYSSEIEAGPYAIEWQPPWLTITQPQQNWVTTSQVDLSWLGCDLNGSGLSFYNVYQATTPNGPWAPFMLNTASESLSVNGNDDQTYYFNIQANDQAGNQAHLYKDIQVRTFPYLAVSPASLRWVTPLNPAKTKKTSLDIRNQGGKVMPWNVETNFPYLTLSTHSGLDDSTLPLTLTHPLTYGVFSGVVTITGNADTRDSPLVLPISIEVVDKFTFYLPLILRP